MLLSLCTGRKFKNKNKHKYDEVEDDDDEDNIAPVIFQQKYIDLPSHPQFDDELENRNKKKGITIYVGGQLTPAIPPNLNYIYRNDNDNDNDDDISFSHSQFDIDNAAINDEAPPKIKPRNESYGKKLLDDLSITSVSMSEVDKSMTSHRRYSSQINRHSSSSSHREHNRRYSAGPDNSFYGKTSEQEYSRFNYFNTDIVAANNTSYETNEEDVDISQDILSKRLSNNNLNSILEEENNDNNYEPQKSAYDLSNINYSLNEINENMNINDNIINNMNINDNNINNMNMNVNNNEHDYNQEISDKRSNYESSSEHYNSNKVSHSGSGSESGTTQSVTETSETTESEMHSKYHNNKSDINLHNDTTLKDNTTSLNKDEIPTLTNNKDMDTTENDIDEMNSLEKLKYIENSYDRFMGSALPTVATNKEDYSNQVNNNNNIKITEDLNEYSLQDDSSLFDEAPREIKATYPIPSPKRKIKLLIFGTRDSWYIQYENGEESWSNIPTFLQWRLEVQKKLYPNVLVTWLSMSSDGWCWFVRFADGSIAWRTTIVSLHLLLEKHHTKGTVSKVTFCRNNGWVVIFSDGQVAYNEIPYSLEAELVNFPHQIQDVTISGRKEWVIKRNIIINEDYNTRNHLKSYSIQRNGYYTWSNGLSSFLQDNLIHRNKNIKNIMLCSGTSKSYFLQYNNYHSAFRHHISLTKEINHFKDRKKPYLNPFSVRFSSHTVSVHIKTDTNVRDLVRGVRNKTISFDQLPVLRVIQDPRDGRWWALDNYWLWVLKEAGIRRVTVEILPWTREFLKRVRGKWDVTVLNEDFKPYDYI
ncbi:hypothetical protein BCR32DRAFT_263803 [Anaeromyces robustus]|uniref:Uncharacterized protein n=1 Tax=Anaeromyces robustus TaxID=1754192 RepID=A0A1Y1XQV7_9FUNG|nr:hypothetical protein BCR32DRAFT_263803 [Anaeromyces robustus]|eukprot:ORX88130.1 hypothetical protein BCR32DRAFT_263803 [Anaeromyces robustus]